MSRECRTSRTDQRRAEAGGRSLELRLGRDSYATGGQLSGVLVVRTPRPLDIRSVSVSVTGCETPAGGALVDWLRRRSAFFHREIILSGQEEPRRTSDRASRWWRAFLGRDRSRTLNAGEHIYPFAAPLPAMLPPSYSGKAGSIDYRVTARVRSPAGGGLVTRQVVTVVLSPRGKPYRPIALSYPSTPGTLHESEMRVNLQIPERTARIGGPIRGQFTINNPQREQVRQVNVTLDTCEWVKLTSDRHMQRVTVDSFVLEPEEPAAELVAGDFELQVPNDAPPTVEGTAISVIWLVKMAVETDQPLELKTPVTVYAALPEDE